jgi:hypothetical protein
VLDCLRAWHSKNPAGTVAEAADLLRRYGVSKVIGDKYSAEWVKEAFRSHAISYEWCDLDRSGLYLELLPVINSGAIELLDDDPLLRELQGLERRRGPSGRDRIDHRPGSFDDRANVVAGSFTGSARRSPHREWDSAGGRARSGGSGRAARSARRGSTTCISLPGSARWLGRPGSNRRLARRAPLGKGAWTAHRRGVGIV